MHSTQFGPAKSASFGEDELVKDENKEQWSHDFNKASSHYIPKYTDVKSEHRSVREERVELK